MSDEIKGGVTKTEVIKTPDGKELVVRTPNLKDIQNGQKVYNTTFKNALDSGAFLRTELDDVLKARGLWGPEKEAKFSSLKQELLDAERRLDGGGFKLSEAKDLALEMIRLRGEIRNLISSRTQLDTHTAEGQADNAKFNSLVASCLVYKDNGGQAFYAGLDDYLNHGNDDVAGKAADQLTSLLYGVDSNLENKLPEYKFLRQFKFVDEKLRLINTDGHLVTEDGHLIDENGRYVDKDGNFVDKEGRLVDVDGNYVVEKKPFLDDAGNAVVASMAESVIETASTLSATIDSVSEVANGEAVDDVVG